MMDLRPHPNLIEFKNDNPNMDTHIKKTGCPETWLSDGILNLSLSINQGLPNKKLKVQATGSEGGRSGGGGGASTTAHSLARVGRPEHTQNLRQGIFALYTKLSLPFSLGGGPIAIKQEGRRGEEREKGGSGKWLK